MCLVFHQVVTVRRARRPDSCRYKAHIENGFRLILTQHLKSVVSGELEDSNRGAEHIFPDRFIVPVDFMSFRERLTKKPVSITNDLNVTYKFVIPILCYLLGNQVISAWFLASPQVFRLYHFHGVMCKHHWLHIRIFRQSLRLILSCLLIAHCYIC